MRTRGIRDTLKRHPVPSNSQAGVCPPGRWASRRSRFASNIDHGPLISTAQVAGVLQIHGNTVAPTVLRPYGATSVRACASCKSASSCRHIATPMRTVTTTTYTASTIAPGAFRFIHIRPVFGTGPTAPHPRSDIRMSGSHATRTALPGRLLPDQPNAESADIGEPCTMHIATPLRPHRTS